MNCNKCGFYNPSGSSFCASCGNEILQEQAIQQKDILVRAPFGMRALAFLIDAMLLLIADLLFNLAFYGDPENKRSTFFLLFIIYSWYFTASGGQSIGKMVLHIKVTALDGSNPGAGKALARTFLYFLSYVLCLAGFLMALGKKRLALHDRLTGTNVVSV